MFMSLSTVSLGVNSRALLIVTYEGSTAVATHGNFWLVGVDVDLWVASWAATAVARYDAIARPPDWLLVDEFHGGVWLWLDSAPINLIFPV
jgi:hypothetical protein